MPTFLLDTKVLTLSWGDKMNYLEYLVEKIHTTVVATVDDAGLPVTAAIDIMDYDESGLYFLTAKGKGLYQRLIKRKYISLTGMKGEDTMSCVDISVRGKVQEIGSDYLSRLFEKNPYMTEIYPTDESRKALTVFKIYEGMGEWFDLSRKTIERASFSFGNTAVEAEGYFITDACVGCGSCLSVCSQNCISEGEPFTVQQKHCLHCGNCLNVCQMGAVEKTIIE